MNDQTGTYRISPKAYPFHWKRFALVVVVAVLLVVVIHAKFVA